MSDDKSRPEKLDEPFAASFLYRLTIAFPSWAGALLAVYSISLRKFSSLNIRFR
jgi:hypothetical protein